MAALLLGAVQSILTCRPEIDVTAATGVAGALADNTVDDGEKPLDHPKMLRTLNLKV